MIPTTESDTITLAVMKAIALASYGKPAEGSAHLREKVRQSKARALVHPTAGNAAIARAWREAADQYVCRFGLPDPAGLPPTLTGESTGMVGRRTPREDGRWGRSRQPGAPCGT